MAFTTPLALILLLICLPIIWYLGWPRLSYRRRRDITSLLLRTAIIVLLVFALAGAQSAQSADRLAVIFLIDASDSMGQAAREAALDYVRQSLQTMRPDDEAGVIQFGSSAVIERALSNVRELGASRAAPPTGNTDLEKAIRLALGMLPSDAARRIVILSDGAQTVGDAASAAELAAATGVEISFVPYTPADTPEVQVSNVSVPSAINDGQNFDLNLTIAAEAATEARITVLESGQIIHQQPISLRQGSNNYSLSLTAAGSGFKDFQVQVDPVSNDGFYQNNQLSAFSRVVGPPRILLVAPSAEEVQYLQPALEQAGLRVDVVAPEGLPVSLVPLAQYQSIVLANVSAVRLTPQRMQALQSYVRDLGGGLVSIGGPESYGPGGYFQTPLEETLPLESQVKDQQRLPQLTIAFVIDRSGSMGVVGPSGVTNLDLAKEAIIRSIDMLQPNDRAGVVSFDSVGYWIANIQPVRDRTPLQRLVASLDVGGGTDILAGMTLVSQDIAPDPSPRKHIILLTDGGADPTGLVELTTRLNNDDRVTTSVIAIGTGIPGFLQQMAQTGGGNFHQVEVVQQIPAIFTQEVVLATRSYIVEEGSFAPLLTATSSILNGISAAPQLSGYVATTAKQTAQVILRTDNTYRDPLLASWQYGLGRAVSFTSDATARWGANWVNWGDYVRFWDQTVRWTITEGTTNNIESRVVMEGEQARLIVDARDDQGGFLNGLDLQMSLVDPEGQPQLTTLRQVAPGRYEAVFTPGAEGAYLLAVRGGSEGDTNLTLNQTTGWVMSYSAEYDRTRVGDGAALLAEVAALTGGRSMLEDPALAFNHNLTAAVAGTPLWPLLTLIALLLLPLDIAVRRLVITQSDLARLRQALFGRMSAEPTAERITTLMDAKLRGRQRAESSSAATTASVLLNRKSQSSESIAPPVPTNIVRPTEPTAAPTPTASADGNIAGQLLKKRKDRS